MTGRTASQCPTKSLEDSRRSLREFCATQSHFVMRSRAPEAHHTLADNLKRMGFERAENGQGAKLSWRWQPRTAHGPH